MCEVLHAAVVLAPLEQQVLNGASRGCPIHAFLKFIGVEVVMEDSPSDRLSTMNTNSSTMVCSFAKLNRHVGHLWLQLKKSLGFRLA